MRITHSMIGAHLISNIQHNLEGLTKAQERMSTGKKVNRPSDDPSACSQIMGIKSNLNANQQYMRNMDDGLGWLNMADTALSDGMGLLHRVRELAVQGANGTLTPEDMRQIAFAVDGIINGMFNVANASLGGKYIFAGLKNTTAPFQRAGDSPVYGGDHSDVYREIAPGSVVAVNANGEDLFTGMVNALRVFNGSGVQNISGRELQNGEYVLKTEAGVPAAGQAVQETYSFGRAGESPLETAGGVALDPSSDPDYNASILMKVDRMTYDEVTGEWTGVVVKFTSHQYDKNGNYLLVEEEQAFNVTGNDPVADNVTLGSIVLNIDLAKTVAAGDKAAIAVTAQSAGTEDALAVRYGDVDTRWVFNADTLNNKSSELRFFTLDETTGDAYDGYVDVEIETLDNPDLPPQAATFNYQGDIFRSLVNLRTRLEEGNPEGVGRILGQLDDSLNWLLQYRVRMGARTEHMEAYKNHLQNHEVRVISVLSGLQDSDIARTSVDFGQRHLAYQAALSAGARMLQTSLLNYLM